MFKINLIANYLGQGLSAIIGFLLIPVYISYLGIEAYGVIGFFALIQVWMSFWEAGFATILNKEFSKISSLIDNINYLRTLLRSIELISIIIALIIMSLFYYSSGWLSKEWFSTESFSHETLSNALALMGIVFALKFIENLYKSVIIGLQKQVLLNIINFFMNMIRGVGAIIILATISNDLYSFFLWHVVFSVFSLVLTAYVVYKLLPRSTKTIKISFDTLSPLKLFGGGVVLITLLNLLAVQSDKIILSKLLTLSEYGYYSLAVTAATVINMLLGPIVQAFFPKMCQTIAEDHDGNISRIYHISAQIVSVVFGGAAIFLIFNTKLFLLLWTKDALIVQRISTLVQLLLVANLINGLIWIPFQAQLAYGWTSLIIKSHVTVIVLTIPCILYLTPIFGLNMAGFISILLNIFYFTVTIHYMHKKIMRTEKFEWYLNDVATPIVAFGFTLYCFSLFFSEYFGSSNIGQIIFAFLSFSISLMVSFCCCKRLRVESINALKNR